MKLKLRTRVTLFVVFTGVLCFARSTALAEKTGDYFREDQNIPTGTVATDLPFAYYPSVNKLEVAIQLTDDLIDKANGGNGSEPTPRAVHVLVRNASTGEKAATGVVSLDGEGSGRSLLDVPDFADGEYTVEYTIGRHKVVSPKRFKRIHFPFEKTAFGEEHTVYPPFLPVKVKGSSVEVVGRSYSLNAFCLFDKVESLGRELLVSPITLVGVTVDGKEIVWSKGTVSGKAVHEDEAVFNGDVSSPQMRVQSQAVIGEDGCAEVKLRFEPVENKTPIESLKLIVPLKDKDAKDFGLLLLQSYSRTDAVKVKVKFPEAGTFVDVLSGERIPASQGVAVIDMPDNFSSRLFTIASRL